MKPECACGADLRGEHYTESCEKCDKRKANRESGKKIGQVRAAIIEMTKGRRNVRGKITCPACNAGVVNFSVAHNGHVWATCTTTGCVAWIE